MTEFAKFLQIRPISGQAFCSLISFHVDNVQHGMEPTQK